MRSETPKTSGRCEQIISAAQRPYYAGEKIGLVLAEATGERGLRAGDDIRSIYDSGLPRDRSLPHRARLIAPTDIGIFCGRRPARSVARRIC
jgi:hypothetical protein